MMKPVIFKKGDDRKNFYVFFDRPCGKLSDYWFVASSGIIGHNIIMGSKTYNTSQFLKENPSFREYPMEGTFDDLKKKCTDILTIRLNIQIQKLKNI